MPEEGRVVGDMWEARVASLLTALGWKQHGELGFDIECFYHSKERHGQGHGVDGLFSYHEPYLGETIPVIVECKSREWSSINASNMTKWIKQLVSTLECAPLAAELRPFDFPRYHTGLLCVWSNDMRFDKAVYEEYLSQIELPSKRANFQIIILSPDDTLWLCSMLTALKTFEGPDAEWRFRYPSVDGSNGSLSQQLSLIQMRSRYIFARASSQETRSRNSIHTETSIVFYHDEISYEGLQMMYSAFKQYQMEEADRFVFYFPQELVSHRNAISGFIDSVKQSLDEPDRDKIVEYRFMDRYADFPQSLNGGEVHQ